MILEMELFGYWLKPMPTYCTTQHSMFALPQFHISITLLTVEFFIIYIGVLYTVQFVHFGVVLCDNVRV